MMDSRKKSSAPHGGWLKEQIRLLANQIFNDRQRKKIKSAIHWTQQIPLRLFGVNALFQAQQAEIDRMKSRLAILDGKLNLALYGFPMETSLRAELLSNSLLHELEFGPEVQDWLLKSQNAALEGVPHSFRKKWIQERLGKRQVGDYLALGQTRLESEIEFQESGVQIHPQTHPISALLALKNRKFELISVFRDFCYLTPAEQLHLIGTSIEMLKNGGLLYLELPDLGRQDLDQYYKNPNALRPYSKSMLKEVLTQFKGKISLENVGMAHPVLLLSFVKGE